MEPTGQANRPSSSPSATNAATSASPHPFFYWCLFAAVAALAATIDLDASSPPAVSLESVWLYRLEVGAAVFLVLYALGLLVGFAYFGKAVPQLDLPGGGGMQLPADGDLNRAAEEIDQLVEGDEDRYASLIAAIGRLDERISRLEPPAEEEHP